VDTRALASSLHPQRPTSATGTTRAITITSVADATQNRTGDISDTLTNAQTKIFGPFAVDGFKQTDGYLWFSGAHAEVLFTVIRF
jgi:hypothetical protein